MALEKDFFRQVMGHFATGVTVVTTNNRGTLSGLTVNAFCSVSLDPPLVLVCVDVTSNTLPLIREGGNFAVNILTDDQEPVSRCFATPSIERYEQFCHAPYHTAVTGAPVLDDVLAFVDTRLVAEYPGGDHVIFLGQVEAMGLRHRVEFADDEASKNSTLPTQTAADEKQALRYPLGYYRGQYRHLSQLYSTPSIPHYE
jgi:flavin reductase (DIM6/NTAB) family NADH-FMN oxidoreductase RutF